MTPQDRLFFKIVIYGLAIGFLIWFALSRPEQTAAIFNILTPW